MKLKSLVESIPRLFRLILAITVLTLIILFGLRLIFWYLFKNPADPISTGNLLHAFYLGTKFDLRLTLYVLLPLFLLGWIHWLSPFRNNLIQRIWLIYLSLASVVVFLFYLADFGHFAYLHKRIDATVLRFLEDPATSASMVWESYAVIPWSLAVLALVILNGFVIHKILQHYARKPAPPIKRRHKLWIAPLSFFIFLFAIFGKFSYYPLRWSDAFFSTHAYASSVASNPVLYFFNTVKNQKIVYNEQQTQQYYDLMSRYLGVDNPDKASLNFRRHIPATPHFNKPPNIVLVFLESFAAYKTGTYGNTLDPTPHFDKLAKESLFFDRYYTPHTGTARSVFAAITGLPDIEVNKTSSRNPLVVDQHTIINHFADYEKLYFIGGSANWGNIRGVLQNNILGLKLYEEGSYTLPRMDVWGIDDVSLFIEANWVLRKQKEPFFAIIQTSGNHRPYHIPEENYGFTLKDYDNDTLKKNGFIGLAEYNAFRFMDHSLGYFIEQVKKEDYFDNTLFVFFGDHGIAGYSGDHSKDYLTHTRLNEFLTPLLIYAPKLIKPDRNDTVASELDLLPTVAGLVGIEYDNTTLGRDLLDKRFDDQRYAFTISHNKISTLGLIGKNYYFRIQEDGSNPVLTDLNAQDTTKNLVQEHEALAQQMRELTFGIFETTKYLLHHNKPLVKRD